jgi:type II secretory ATPase GspE/PulE/Tfp pilus assembly ATPase PilB-like protein
MRILRETNRPLSLEELGITGQGLKIIRTNLEKPHGMILITGPTGSGKTTTLYSLLNIVNTVEVKICTIEDPIEYGINRVSQIQVNPKTGLTFAAGLRALMRHDPDIIMVGEIRDEETAEIAIHSALTGHLVLSTLHTNTAAGAIPRFIDMGAEPFLLASTINVIIAQRLVRHICPSCITKYTPEEVILKRITKELGSEYAKIKFYKGRGCDDCNQKGYSGRIGIYEVLPITEKLRELIIQKPTTEEILKTAISEGMITMLQDGIDKVSAGLTTIEEVFRVASES